MVILIHGPMILKAEEGMWIPMLLERTQLSQMQEAGLRLSAEDIYSINQDCLKDAVVIFGNGCTGEIISEEGLLLTNHHCGEGAVQSHSSVENDYLTHGFWALSRDKELPNERLSVTFLRYMKDVTSQVQEGIMPGMDPQVRERTISENMGRLILEATSGTYLDATVKPFYYGNEYYLFVYEKFTDVRLVGAPPVSIGNFGGDTDNWMWPRHTGDFSLFRIYADRENRPAAFNPSNQPYKPRKSLEIAAGGVAEGDFTMILGYPGSTTEYLYSEGVRINLEESLPLRVRLRTTRMEIMDKWMKSSDEVRIQYTTKYRRLTNAWKKWQGAILGLNRLEAVERKIGEEEAFMKWVNASGERQFMYDGILDRFSQLYGEIIRYSVAVVLMEEAIEPVELFNQVSRMVVLMRQGVDPVQLKSQAERFYKNFFLPVDREIFAAMISACQEHLSDQFLPGFFSEIREKYRGDFNGFAEDTYGKSIFSDKDKVMRILELYERNPGEALERLLEDPVAVYLNQFMEIYMVAINPAHLELQAQLGMVYKTYMRALVEMSPEKGVYPDANFTMRLSYGTVQGYEPRDGVHYQYTTTLDGLMEKWGEGSEDYTIPEKLSQLYREKDYGRYGVDGTMPVCFIASNHTSGGNSGSPVLDAEGRLIGINFDRNWEGTMSDILYDPSLCRNIAVDIRYVLFIMDKFAGAGYLMDEMNITW